MKYRLFNQKQQLSFHDLFNTNDLSKEHWLYITAHDDDPLIGSGILMSIALNLRIKINLLIVTLGNMGYRDSKLAGQKIVELRKKETYAAYKLLGLPENNIHYLGFPDADLFTYQGRRKLNFIDRLSGKGKVSIKGHWGLQNSLVYYLRKIKPNRVFLHTPNDYHPDHKIVFGEALWSNFFAASECWPELGRGLEAIPQIYEYFVYSDLTATPDYQVSSEDGAVKRNAAIRMYQSQGEIHGLVQELETAGPLEWFREYNYIKADRQKLNELFPK